MSTDSSPTPTGTVSIVDSLSQAIVRSRDVLFRPFDPVKWFVLGFCAWLAGLGERGGAPNFNFSGHPHDGRYRGDFEDGAREAWYWLLDHLLPILFIGCFLVVLGIIVWLLFLWLSSRGKFMFLDGVVHDRAAVVEPWQRFREPANALFRFRIVVGLICAAMVLAFLVFAGFLVWTGVEDHEFGPPLILIFVCGLIPFVAAMIGFSLVGLAINDFVVPLMYLRGGSVGAAWRELGRLVSDRPGTFVLYVLLKIVIAIAVAVIAFCACCATCCIILLPYIGVVILLPIAVFGRAFPLYVLGQFGPDYTRFATLGPGA